MKMFRLFLIICFSIICISSRRGRGGGNRGGGRVQNFGGDHIGHGGHFPGAGRNIPRDAGMMGRERAMGMGDQHVGGGGGGGHNFDGYFGDFPQGGSRGGMGGEGNSRHSSSGSYTNTYNNGQDMTMNNSNNRNSFTNNWLYQCITIMVFFSFLYNCFCGKTANDKYAKRWYYCNKEFFDKNYAHQNLAKNKIKIDMEEEDPNDVPIIKDSSKFYKFYANGRKNVTMMFAGLYFKKNRDHFSMFNGFNFNMETDQIIYQFTLSPDVYLPTVFCVVKKSTGPEFTKTFSDINYFTDAYEDLDYIDDNFVVLAENIDIVDYLFKSPKIKQLYPSIEKFVDSMYFTDQKTFVKERCGAAFTFDVPLDARGIEKLLLAITYFVHVVIDELSNYQMNSDEKYIAHYIREEYDELRDKNRKYRTVFRKVSEEDLQNEKNKKKKKKKK